MHFSLEHIVWPDQISIDHHLLAGVTFAGAVLGTLGSLYLTDDLLRRRVRVLGGITAFLTFGIPFLLGFGLVGGLAAGVLAGALNGLWMALRVMEMLPGGYSVSGVIQWGVALGIVVLLTRDPVAGVAVAAIAIACGLPRYTVRIAASVRKKDAQPVTLLRRHWRQALFGMGIILVTAILMVVTAVLLHTAGLIVAPVQLPFWQLALVAAVLGWYGSAGPGIVHWARALPAGGLGAIGVGCILAGFLAQALVSLASLLDVAVR